MKAFIKRIRRRNLIADVAILSIAGMLIILPLLGFIGIFGERSDASRLPITCEEGVDEKYKAKILHEASALPQEVVDRFITEGWDIILSQDDFSERFNIEGSFVLGVCMYTERTIYVNPCKRGVLLHEMGHFWDYMVTGKSGLNSTGHGVSDRVGFLLLGSYAQDENEWFAEAFRLYLSVPEPITRLLIPKSIRMVGRTIKEG